MIIDVVIPSDGSVTAVDVDPTSVPVVVSWTDWHAICSEAESKTPTF